MMINSLMKNMGVTATTTQGVQLQPTPLLKPVHQPSGAIVVPTSAALQKGAVVAESKDNMEGQKESKAQALVLQGAVLITMEPIILGCVVGKSLTIKAVHPASRFFAINDDADLLQKLNHVSRRPRKILNGGAETLS